MTRFLGATGACLALMPVWAGVSVEPETVRLTVHPQETLNAVPLDYTGLSYETMQLTDPDFFSPDNQVLIALFRRLSPHGVLRLGGNSSEFGWWKPTPDAQPPVLSSAGVGRTDNWMPQKFYAVEPRAIDNLAGFLKKTGWTAIYGLNFGSGTPERDAAEAAYVAKKLGHSLKYFQIGNEPDFYRNANNRVRPAGWNFDDYVREWTAIADAVTARVPNARFGGPDVGSSSDWVPRFAEAVAPRLGKRLVALSGHYYAEGPPDSPSANITNLLAHDPRVVTSMERIMPVAHKLGLTYRMTEGNSCYRGGKPGMSNALAGSLWGGDYLMEMAALGGAGVNLHGGGGQQISASLGNKLPGAQSQADLDYARLGTFYSPIAGSRAAGFTARPIFYGMMLADQFAGATLVRTEFDSSGTNATAYAARQGKGFLVAVFNKDAARDLTVAVDLGNPEMKGAKVWRLTGPALDATTGIRFAGAAVRPQGSWLPQVVESLRAQGGTLRVDVPHASAALLLVSR